MKAITKEMINDFKIETLGYDFMGYTFEDINELSFHHMIVPKRDCRKLGLGTGYLYWNGAILVQTSSHEYLHAIERYEREIFEKITDLLTTQNLNKCIDKDILLYIREYLLYFESKYGNETLNSGKKLIKGQYINNRIDL